MENDNELDQLFKNRLSEPDIPFNEFDWQKMEQKLDAKDRKRVLPLWVFQAAGLVAAMLLIVLWFFSKPTDAVKVLKRNSVVKNKPTIINIPQTSAKVYQQHQLTNRPEKLQPAVPQITLHQLQPVSTPISIAAMTPVDEATVKPRFKQRTLPEAVDSTAELARKANALAMSRDPLERLHSPRKIGDDELKKSIRKSMEEALSSNHQLVLSAMAAPDVSTAKASKSSKLSSNIGMLATYALGKKISVTSGAIYARKFYNSEGTTASTYGTATNTWEVYADCNVLDVPLNVNYKLIGGKKLSVSLNTGLSSYFMLKEKYDYVTDLADGSQKVTTLEINNQNTHLLGVANVAVSIDHHITDNISVGIQPFAKLPLTGIGYGNASLKSAGVSFSLNFGLFPAKKPSKYAALR